MVTRGSTLENAANLSASYIDNIQARYGGTRLGLQEIQGQIVEEGGGALWTSALIENARPKTGSQEPTLPLIRVIVAIDPSVRADGEGDEAGLIVAGKDDQGRGYILEDASGPFPPLVWAERAVQRYQSFGADCIVAEVNNGGDLVERLIRSVDDSVAYKGVRATRGKILRAEPVASLYAQGRIIHVRPFPELEQQMLTYTPDQGGSPDRLDALVWALTELFLSSAHPAADPATRLKVWRV